MSFNVPYHAYGNRLHSDCEHGVITSFNVLGTIFVKFGAMQNSQGCQANQLVLEM
jgi:hypothetical protein